MSQLMMMGAGKQAVPASSGELSPSFSNVKFLYNDEGTNGNNPNGDSALVGGVITVGGTATYNSGTTVFGSGVSVYSATGTLRVPYSSTMNIGSQDAWIETWIRYETSVPAAERAIFGQYTTTGNDRAWSVNYNGTNLIVYWSSDGSSASSANRTWSPSADTWYHILLAKDGTTLRLFIDGVKQGTDISASNFRDLSVNASSAFYFVRSFVSAWNGTPNQFHGPTRMVIGETVTADFTPPSGPFPES